MASFNIPASPTKYQYNLTGFLGIDFSSAMSEIDRRRCRDGSNFINNNGTIEKRNGYKVLAYLGDNANINGIWNVDTVNGEFFVIHCGTKLYEMKTDFSSYEVILEGLKDSISTGIIINNKLLILDGKRAVVYDLLVENNKCAYLDTIGRTAITQISRNPDGLASQPYEQVNMVSNTCMNMFLGDATSLDYVLDATDISLPIIVEVLDSNGQWQIKTRDTEYKVDLEKGIVTFDAPVGISPVDERDNVRITYTKEIAENKSQINKCNIMQAYGYAGNTNRVFMSGNPDFPNLVNYSDIDDITYIPVNNIINVGLATSAITGFAKMNDGKLAVLKDVSDTDNTIFYIGYGTFSGVEVFPIEGSAKGEGNIASMAHDVLINEPLILTNNGVFAINASSMTDERFVYHRSYYADGKLLKEPNLKEAVGICNDGKYYLAINNNVYVADSRFKSTSNNSKYSNYQLEWFYFTDIPVRVWFVWNNKLYFGDKSGNICTFRDNSDVDRYKDIDSPVKSYWISPYLNLGQIAYRKNIRRVMISTNPSDLNMDAGYILKNGTKHVLQKIYENSSFPKIITIRKQAKRLGYFALYLESNNEKEMCFNDITIIYTLGTLYKGD